MASPWSWNRKSKRYEDERGRQLDLSTMSVLYDRFDQNIERNMRNHAGTANDPDAWFKAMQGDIRTSYVDGYVLGHGGRDTMTHADWGRLGAMTRKQYAYLQRFQADIINGRYTDPETGELNQRAIAARSQLYARSARQAYERGRVLGQGCPDLPAYPGDGSTECLANCRCLLDIRRTLIGWDCHWIVAGDEHSCETCESRGVQWSPLQVSDPFPPQPPWEMQADLPLFGDSDEMMQTMEEQREAFDQAYEDAQQRGAAYLRSVGAKASRMDSPPSIPLEQLNIHEIARRLSPEAHAVLGVWFAGELKEQATSLGYMRPWMTDAEGMTQYLTASLSVTTGDSCLMSQIIQDAAGKKFGGEIAANAATKRKVAEYAAKYPERAKALVGWVTAVYDNAQAQMADIGVGEVWLFRGMRLSNVPLDSLGVADLKLQPLSSFAADFDQAKTFTSVAGWPPSASPTMMFARAPASRVWSSYLSGPGREGRSEFLLAGGDAEAYMLSSPASGPASEIAYGLADLMALCVARGRDNLPYVELAP